VITFDSATGACVTAIYGGCGGNANLFRGIAECESTCASHLQKKFESPNPEVCSLPAITEQGKGCRGIFPRFTFNSELGRCERYSYGGCKGTLNLFLTEEECIKTCLNGDTVEPKEWFRPKTAAGNTAIQFPDDEDDSSEESSDESSEDDGQDICSLPPIIPGVLACFGYVPKWTYSSREGACVQYIYGGCRGTENLFDSQADCQAACSGKKGKTADVCNLSIKPGPCRGRKNVFGFNSATGRCQAFRYGGCQGNENIFETAESCVNTCGGETPLLDGSACAGATCDAREAALQRSKGCVPITREGECCPSSWDCSTWEKRLDNKDKCFAVSAAFPSGKFYADGENIDASTEDGCTRGCFCALNGEGEAEMVCAEVDCAMPRDIDNPGRCVAQYRSIDSCCAADFKCDAEQDSLGSCNVDGRSYKFGEKMYPKKNPCLVCLCQEGWDGTLDAPYCKEADCELYRSTQLAAGCQPIYREDVCCPIDWICPGDQALETPRSAPLVNVVAESAIKNKDRCLLPPESAQCQDTSFRFYFDKQSASCVKFEGCSGSLNNFETREECDSVCQEYVVPGAVVAQEKTFFPAQEKRCEEEVKVGRCRSRLKKYFYDVTTGKCNEFYYSGCQGGGNNFDELRECVSTCVAPASMLRGRRPKPAVAEAPSADPCSLPLSAGPCRAFKPRFFYDESSGTCQEFLYGGCGGNANNFEDRASCENKCSLDDVQFTCAGCPSPSVIDQEALEIADLAAAKLTGVPAVTGSQCQHAQLLEVVDVQTQVVAGTNYIFTLRMTTKTGSNCENEEVRTCSNIYAFKPLPFACTDESKCIEIIRQDEISCELNSPPFIQIGGLNTLPARVPGGSPSGGQVGSFIPAMPGMPGAPQAGTITPTVKKVAALAARQLASVSAVARSCEHAKLLEIVDVQEQVVAGTNYILTLKMSTKTGADCADLETRVCSNIYAFKPLSFACTDKESMCIEIIRQDQITCTKEADQGRSINPEIEINIIDPCSLDKAIGECKAAIPRFYYDKKKGTCHPFLYGGCRGNANNFVSMEDCERKCDRPTGLKARSGLPAPSPQQEKCTQPLDAGPCFALKPRFFYNADSRRCEEFLYGGCRGNQNNFHTMQECVSNCGKHKRGRPSLTNFLPSVEPRCTFGNESYAVGDIVRLGEDPCRSCVCSSPPDLSCSVKKCPLLAAISSDCTPIKDDIGCCTERFDCPSSGSGSGGAPGSFPILGGAARSPINAEAKKIAAIASQRLLTGVPLITGVQCEEAQLIELIDIKTQVVAGTNYILTLRLRAKQGPGCRDDFDRFCDNITVHKPLPFACQGDDCLELIREDDIRCFETRDQL